jgi:putative DNA primase/helicase
VITDTSILKNISGNDAVQVEKKYKDPVPVRIFCKLWIATNDITFRDTSKGFEERLVPIPFVNTYVSNPRPGTNERLRDNELEKKLMKELPGIFNWMYEGLVRLRANNWRTTECEVIEEQRSRLVEESNPVQLFVNVMVQKVVGGKTKKPDTYRRFKEWAQTNGINVSSYISAQKFYPKFEAIMRSKGFTSATKRIQGEDYYCDFTINSSNDPI